MKVLLQPSIIASLSSNSRITAAEEQKKDLGQERGSGTLASALLLNH